jgi:hypothetical protein
MEDDGEGDSHRVLVLGAEDVVQERAHKHQALSAGILLGLRE